MTDAQAPLTRATIAALVIGELALILEVNESQVSEEATFAELGADSLALIELVEAIEESLASRVEGFRIDDEDLESLTSVRDAVDYVVTKLQVA